MRRANWVPIGQQHLHPFRSTEGHQRIVEPAPREIQETSCMVHDQLGTRLTPRMQRVLRPLQPPLDLIKAESRDPDSRVGSRRRSERKTKVVDQQSLL